MKTSLLSVLIALMSVGLATASDDWTGLWRVSRFYQGKLDGVYHFRISDQPGDRVTVFTDDFRPMINQSVTFDGDVLEIQVANSAIQPLPLLFKLRRKMANLAGNWVFSQFQFDQPLEGKAVGFLVLPQGEWDPWRLVKEHRGDRTLDLLGLLREKAPLRTFGRFQSFWTEQVEPDFYVLIHHWLYGDGKNPEDTKRESLRKLHTFLAGSNPSLRLAEKFPQLAQKALDTAQERFEEPSPIFFVSSFGQAISESLQWTRVPTPEEEETCACKLDLRERFVLFNPAEFPASETGAALLLKEMLRKALWTNPPPALAVEAFRQGLAFQLAWAKTGHEAPLLGGALVDLMREQFADEILSQPSGQFPQSPRELALSVSLGLVLGQDLVNSLLAKKPLTEVLQLSDPDVMLAWRDYLGYDKRKVQTAGR